MPVPRVSRVLSIFVAAGLAAGCLEFDRSIALNKDGSGRATARMTMDIEAMLEPMMQMMAAAKGKAGPPTPAELAAMKKEALDEMRAEFEKDPATIEVTPVPGVTAIEKTVKLDGSKLLITAVFGFSEPSKIPLLSFTMKGPGPSNRDRPMALFEEFEVTADAGTVVIRTKGTGAAAAGGATPPAPDMMKGLMGLLGTDSPLPAMLKGAKTSLRFATRIDAPWAVVETNAPRKDGTALLWEISLDSMEKMMTADAARNVLVRYKR